MFLQLALVAAGLLASHAQPVPLPNTPDGWVIGGAPDVPVIEAFFDLLCPDCAGDSSTISALLAHYGKKITYVMHTFPLPYHTYAFRCAQGAHVVGSLNKTVGAVWDFALMMFANQNDFFGADLNETWVDNHIAALASNKLGYSSAAIAAGLADDNLNEATRISWKYGTSRYTTGTPHYMVNGLPVDDQLGNGQLSDWIALLDPLINGAAPRLPKGLQRFAKGKGKDL